jgi:hypothetical protein
MSARRESKGRIDHYVKMTLNNVVCGCGIWPDQVA